MADFCALEDLPESEKDGRDLSFYDFFRESYYAVSAQSYEGTLILSRVGHWDDIVEKQYVYEQFISALGGGVINLYELASQDDDEPILINQTVIDDMEDEEYDDYEYDDDE